MLSAFLWPSLHICKEQNTLKDWRESQIWSSKILAQSLAYVAQWTGAGTLTSAVITTTTTNEVSWLSASKIPKLETQPEIEDTAPDPQSIASSNPSWERLKKRQKEVKGGTWVNHVF